MTSTLTQSERIGNALSPLLTANVVAPEKMSDSHWKLSPTSAQAVAETLKVLSDHHQLLSIHADQSTDVNTGGLSLHLDLSRVNTCRKLSPADLTVSVESGMRFGDFQTLLSENDLYFPLLYANDVLLADIFAEDRLSFTSARFGLPRDYVLGCEIATTDGNLSKTGGEVMKNVAGYDLAKLYCGNFHTLGALTAITLKVVAKPSGLSPMNAANMNAVASGIQRVWFPVTSLTEAQTLFETLQDHQQHFAADGWMLIQDENSLGIAAQWSGPLSRLLENDTALTQRELTSEAWPEAIAHHCQNLLIDSKDNNKVTTNHDAPPGYVIHISMAQHRNHARRFEALCQRFESLSLKPNTALYLPGNDVMAFRWTNESLSTDAHWQAWCDCLCQLQNEFSAEGGFVRIMQAPHDTFDLLQFINLPSDPMLRSLMHRLKAGYDPNHLLYSRYLPLRDRRSSGRGGR